MLDSHNYSWKEIVNDVFAALFLTTLSFVLIELVRPGSISSAINIFLLFIISIGLSLILALANGQSNHRLPRSLFILAALLISVIIMTISAVAPLERFILGIVSFAAMLFFAFIL
ncbi:hypothetical protein A3H10_03340 [Candidatus Uhrbacteria bacterium RIFCSPLOWO2_12_FULL_46_10]|uniref:Uncharacterized protein n=1 Tax=Candidatus Uhrbacteria bacterium RIFCSPLOWO2_01_FULL_47_25 TaxID=1802402 RepID=A0A1F7UPQ8_9BACT|nr:MAG: hypothetical protein A2752_00640 [Candidatus Uhrbacteria bacterium RIFCSPHIGHO2_01_FULL_46_23]OGL69198.1 MAG: hypothetical protein A3D60_04845 [Candidatus Uhrbacteria bacterium RIFCSPHIGHO2_02_FULL_47_29]OGL75301.1 MAG: hypothetical protein A3E96_01365 [Candidatus Uhrbacteria bacterium RIFCSPHIGHO2_12_FULL_46_13]OGL80261.1 MAG: hypothetical protein A2936_02750 [Candidatus Uhrbacteria bacterium RIFCSPLOWO2_01_FULL_47_25]OGL85336.1 MAG: hypothetical protein A3I37_00655 [Candidatus Uhrbact